MCQYKVCFLKIQSIKYNLFITTTNFLKVDKNISRKNLKINNKNKKIIL